MHIFTFALFQYSWYLFDTMNSHRKRQSVKSYLWCGVIDAQSRVKGLHHYLDVFHPRLVVFYITWIISGDSLFIANKRVQMALWMAFTTRSFYSVVPHKICRKSLFTFQLCHSYSHTAKATVTTATTTVVRSSVHVTWTFQP